MIEQASQQQDVQPRTIIGWNSVGLSTLIKKEVGRFMAVYLQTVIAPVVTMLLFYTVFMLAFGGIARTIGDVGFLEFLAPGLIMMAMAQNAFANTSSSLIIAKVQGNIVDILMPPLSSLELFIGMMSGAVVRALCVGIVAVLTVSVVVGMPFYNVFYILGFGLLGSVMMGGLGIIGGIWADKFDHIAAFTNFVITPFTFLSGTFYSIQALPEVWRGMALYNPFFYMIDGFRAGFIEQADSNILFGFLILIVTNIMICYVSYRMIKTGYKIKS